MLQGGAGWWSVQVCRGSETWMNDWSLEWERKRTTRSSSRPPAMTSLALLSPVAEQRRVHAPSWHGGGDGPDAEGAELAEPAWTRERFLAGALCVFAGSRKIFSSADSVACRRTTG